MWLVTKIKNIIVKSVKELRLPLFYAKRSQESACHDSNILAAFDGNLVAVMGSQKGIPLDYGS